MKLKPTLTIGIPAYNEGKNARNLVRSLLKQKINIAHLQHIIVYSDGSTDNTVASLRELRNGKIQVSDNPKQQGLATAQNALLNMNDSDVIVLLNADVRILNDRYIETLIRPIIQDKADMVSGRLALHEPKTQLEKTFNMLFTYKDLVFKSTNQGDNVYTCRGAARAMSRRLAKKLRFPHSVGEDAYSYLFTKQIGFRYVFQPSAVLFIKYSRSIEDHILQSNRYLDSKQLMKTLFPKKLIQSAYAIDPYHAFISFVHFLVRHPIYMSTYIAIRILQFAVPRRKVSTQIWTQAKSSKQF